MGGIPSDADGQSPHPDQIAETSGQTAARIIREKILTGDLDPGTKLNQHRLAAELGMSRIPVRDALRSLAGEGLVDLRAHTTAVVADISMEDLQELYELRIAIEPALGRLAIPQLTDRHCDEMADILDKLETTADAAPWLALNNRFHETMYAAAGRKRSLDMVKLIRRQTGRYIAIYLELNHDIANAEHRMILDAARSGQGTRLEALLTAHISASYEEMLRYLANEMRDIAGRHRTGTAPVR